MRNADTRPSPGKGRSIFAAAVFRLGLLGALLKATYPITFAKCPHFEKLLFPYFALYIAHFCL